MREYAILVTNEHLESGRLIVDSRAKVDRAFSVDKTLVRMTIGRVMPSLNQKITNMLFELLRTQ